MIRVVGSAWTGLAAALALGLLSFGSAFAEPGDGVAVVRMAPRGVGEAAKATPRIDVGESYTFGYTTKCLDKKGKPIREALRVFLKGHPTTGGATAALKRKPVYTNQAFDIILRTKEETKPGAYNMTVTVYGGTRCGLIGQAQHLLHLAPKIKVSGAAVVWWFNGEKPAGYDTSLKLFAMGVGGQPYTWRITRGGDKVKIVNKVSNTAEVEGLRGSDDRFDVSVRVASGGVEFDPFLLTVNAPRSLVFLRNVDKADATLGLRLSDSLRHQGSVRPHPAVQCADKRALDIRRDEAVPGHELAARSQRRGGGARCRLARPSARRTSRRRFQTHAAAAASPARCSEDLPLGRRVERRQRRSVGRQGRACQQKHLAEVSRPCPPHKLRVAGHPDGNRTREMTSCVSRSL